MKLGLAIAMRREALGMSQIELAKAVGVSKASVSRWESGDISNMRRDRVYKLAQALRVSPISLLVDETDGLFDEKKDTTSDDIRSSVIEKVNQLSEPQVMRLLAFLEGMLGE